MSEDVRSDPEDEADATSAFTDRQWEAWYTQAFESHQPGLYHYLAWHTRKPQDAEDLCQETFANAWQSRKSLRGIRRTGAWLFTIARHVLCKHWCRRGGESE